MGSRFPTRHYPYRRVPLGAALGRAPDPLSDIAPGAVVRFFLGQDEGPVELATQTLKDVINDPFAALVLSAGHRPKSLQDVLAILDAATGPAAVSEQRIYRVADGGQIAWDPTTKDLDRHLRLVVTRHRGEEAELFISTAPPFTSETVFLQVFAWDPVSRAYNFYERRRAIWSWVGSSWEALRPPTRGRGAFDSHVNGAPVMKELRLPWLNWHSQSAHILDDILAPDDPLRTDALYNAKELKGAEDLELIVRAGIARWTRSRFDGCAVDGRLTRAPEFFRHLLTTTTVNLTCSPQQAAPLTADDVLRLPTTFFLNSDCLIDELALPAALSRQKVRADFYTDCLKRYAVRLQEGPFSLDRDSFFAFAVPEPSLEDRAVLAEMLRRGALSRRLATCLLMVDFCNPVFSGRRARLLRYVPTSVALDGGVELEAGFAAAVAASPEAAVEGSGEAEFLGFWHQDAATWEGTFAARLESYWQALTDALSRPDTFDALFRLSESRRRQFRHRPLAEFGLTLSVATALDLPQPLEMTEAARVVPATTGEDDIDATV